MARAQDTTDDNLKFKISTGLKRIIGRDLITNELVAVFELVKNSFDAHACRVDLFFEDDKLFVIDDGKGMSYDDILNKWLFIAYSSKSDGTEDDYRDAIKTRKAYAGSKGVGRFSCDRLGRSLIMYTKPVGVSSPVHVIELDWDLFEEDSKQEFVNIPVKHREAREFSLPENVFAIEHGTVLEITGLRDTWDRNALLRLKSALAKLINPFGGSVDDFGIYIHAGGELPEDNRTKAKWKTVGAEEDANAIVNGHVENFIFDTLSEKTTWLSVGICADGKQLESTLVDRGVLIYKIREPNPYSLLSESDFSCQLFYLNQSAKNTFSRRMGVSTKDFGSVFLFRNGFRVYPIGEAGDDTFKIDLRKQQGYARYLGTRDILGRIDVTGSEEDFKESTSRDQGLIRTPAYLELEDCVIRKCIRRLEKYVVGVNWQDPLDTETEDASRLSGDKARSRIIEIVSRLANAEGVTLLDYNMDLVGILDEKSADFEQSLANLKLVAEKTENKEFQLQISKAEQAYLELKQAEQQARTQAQKERSARQAAEAKAREEEERRRKSEIAYEEEKKRNLFLTSVSNLDQDTIINLHHQIGIYAADIHNILANQIDKLKYGEAMGKDDMLNLFEQLSFKNQQVLSVSRFATKANFRLDSNYIDGNLVPFIVQYIEEVCSIYAGDGLDLSVNSSASGFVTRFKPIEVSMVIDNLVDNSRKAGATNIWFELTQASEKELEITMTDNGRGLDKTITEPNRIFEKGFSTTTGSGLGLYHVKFILDEMGGGIKVGQVDQNGHTGLKFNIRLRK